MHSVFLRTLRALESDSPRREAASFCLGIALTGAWLAWAMLGRVEVTVRTDLGRLESAGGVRPVQAIEAGEIVRWRLTPGTWYEAGDTLAWLDDRAERTSLAGLLGSFGVGTADEGQVVSVGFSVFNVLGTTATIVAIFFSKALAVRFGKRNVFMVGLAATALVTAVFAILPATAVTAMFACEILRQFAYGFTIPLLWAMMADVADFSEWKTGRRATAIVFAAIVFALKAGLGFGGAITGYVLTLYGYVPNVAQGSTALEGIRLTMSVFPAVTFAPSAEATATFARNTSEVSPIPASSRLSAIRRCSRVSETPCSATSANCRAVTTSRTAATTR